MVSGGWVVICNNLFTTTICACEDGIQLTTKRERYLKQAVIPALARPGDPLVTGLGQRIQPEKPKKNVKAGQPEITAKSFRSSKQRTLGELPATPQVINGCAVVIMYSIMGLGDREIAIAAKIKPEDVLAVKQHPAYEECFGIIAKEFVNSNSELLAARVAGYAHDAVTKIADISANGKQEVNQLRASMHLHDAALGGKNGVQAGGSHVNELRIVIVEGDRRTVDIGVDGQSFNGRSRHGQEIDESAAAE